jgi:hypothetical protein
LRLLPSRTATTSMGTSLSAIATNTSRWRSVSSPIAADEGLELLSPLEPVTGAERKHVRHPLEHGFLTARGLSTPGVARHLAGDLEHHELVGPGSEPAEPAELVELRQDVHERVVRSLVGEIVELGPADRSQLTAPP